MNMFDIVIVVIVSFCLVRGLFRGFIREVSSIVAVIAGFYGAATYYPLVEPFFSRWIDNPGFRKMLVFFLLFCAVLVVINLLAAVIRYFLNIVFLGWVDRLCGLVFGGAKGVLICAVLLIAITTLLPRNSAFISESLLAPQVATVSQAISVFVTGDMQHQLQLKIKGIKKNWEKKKTAMAPGV